jgi:hypothetical protein
VHRTELIGGTSSAARLAARRVARRRGPAALIALSVAATIAVLGALFGVSAEAGDAAIRGALQKTPTADRSVTIERFTDAAVNQPAADALARRVLARLGDVTQPVIVSTWFPPTTGANLVIAIDDPSRWAEVLEGRLPKPCAGGPRCEAVSVVRPSRSVPPTPMSSSVGDIALDVVGSVRMSSDFPLELPTTAGDPLLVDGSGLVNDPATFDVPRTSFWVAPIDPSRLHAWALDDVEGRIDGISRDVAVDDAAMSLEAPGRIFGEVANRVALADGRIVFVGSLIVAVLFAFAFFAAAIDRDDLRAEYRRLVAAGARRRHLTALVATEALLPSIAGAVAGWILAIAIVAAVATLQGVAAQDLLRGSLLSPATTAFLAAAALVLALAVAIGLHPAAGRFVRPRTVALVAVPVTAVLAWDRIVSGAETGIDLASGPAGPGTVLLPGLLGLAVILASLTALPPVFRRLAARSGRFPILLRLAILSIAREPLRPAATLTLLGFSFGSALFGLGYGATLHQGALDSAAFHTGMDVRIEAPTSQTPIVRSVINPIRSGALGSDVELTPTTRLPALLPTGVPVGVLGIDPASIPELRGWRPDFSTLRPDQIRDAIHVAGDWTMPGHPIAAGARTISVGLETRLEPEPSGTQLVLRAVVDTGDGAFRQVDLGRLTAGTQTYTGNLLTTAEAASTPPTEPSGWRIVAIVASLPGLESGFGPPVTIRGTIAIRDLPELGDPGHGQAFEVSISHNHQVLRGPVPTDGLVFPAVISPALEGELDSDGQLTIALPSGLDLHVKPVALATSFPTMDDPSRSAVIVDAAPLLEAVNADNPGQGVPNGALLRTPDDGRTAQVASALATDPFPPLEVTSLPALVTVIGNDPFALGLSAALLVGAVAGLTLALAGMLLAALAELRDERGELADLEEQGLGPAALRRLTALRALLVVVVALVAGTIVGVGLTWFGILAVAVGLDGSLPVPPLVVLVPWAAVVALAAGLLAAVIGGSFLLGRGRFGEGRLLREARS